MDKERVDALLFLSNGKLKKSMVGISENKPVFDDTLLNNLDARDITINETLVKAASIKGEVNEYKSYIVDDSDAWIFLSSQKGVVYSGKVIRKNLDGGRRISIMPNSNKFDPKEDDVCDVWVRVV